MLSRSDPFPWPASCGPADAITHGRGWAFEVRSLPQASIRRFEGTIPVTDYDDPEVEFPRLEARIQKIADDFYWLTIWLWERRRRADGARSLTGSRPAVGPTLIDAALAQFQAHASEDDIVFEDMPDEGR
jgi:hypothetical protein